MMISTKILGTRGNFDICICGNFNCYQKCVRGRIETFSMSVLEIINLIGIVPVSRYDSVSVLVEIDGQCLKKLILSL